MKQIYLTANNNLRLTFFNCCHQMLGSSHLVHQHIHTHPVKALIKICLWYGPNVFKKGSGGGTIKTQRLELKWSQRGAIMLLPPSASGGWESVGRVGESSGGWTLSQYRGQRVLPTPVSFQTLQLLYQCLNSYSNAIRSLLHHSSQILGSTSSWASIDELKSFMLCPGLQKRLDHGCKIKKKSSLCLKHVND